ncbi:MAG: hypothetical protein H6825_13080 [Planctomycetes bacterium]|nr:hypothetical protein [Planctomycetota bacterium]
MPSPASSSSSRLGSSAATALAALGMLASASSAQTTLGLFTDSAPDTSAGSSIADAGDVDGDGVSDVIFGAPDADFFLFHSTGRIVVRSGRTGEILFSWSSTGPGERFGHAVTGLGDVDGDGFCDVAASAPGYHVGADYDRIRLYGGADGALLRDLEFSTDDDTGWSLAGGGDTNANGVLELLCGAPRATVGGLLECGSVRRLEIYAPDLITIDTPYHGIQPGSHAGWDVDFLDFDADGEDDILVGEPDFDGAVTFAGDIPDEGRAVCVTRTGMLLWYAHGFALGDRLGAALASVGDLDLDGDLDAALGSPGWDGEKGRVTTTAAGGAVAVGASAGNRFGHDVAGMPDLDLDGIPEILVGEPGWNAFFPVLAPDAGRVSIHDGLTLAEMWAAITLSPGAGLGWSVTSLADITHDGVPDFAAGTPYVDGVAGSVGGMRTFSTVDAFASATPFGAGLAGTLGVPALTASAPPEIGGSTTITFGNSAGTPTLAVLFLGLAQASLPFKGGTLHTDPLVTVPIVGLPTPSLALPLAIPYDTWLCGFELWLQGAEADPGAIRGSALTPALVLTFGG